MARIFTAGDVITKARRQVKMDNASGLKFVTADEALRLTSHAWTWLHGLLVKADPDYFEGTQSAITTGLDRVALPGDYFETKRVDYQSSSTQHIKLKKITSRDILAYEGTSSSTATAYRIVGSYLVLYPTPPSGQTYRHLYIPAPEDLTDDDDEIDGRAGWEELLVLRVAMRMAMKSGDDITDIKAELEAELQRIIVQADQRNPFEGDVIADVEDYSDGAAMMRPYRYAGE